MQVVQGAQSGSAETTVVVNQPPSSGTCEACVAVAFSGKILTCGKTGAALQDTVRMSCINWADEDQPLQYRIGIAQGDGEPNWFDYTLDFFKDVPVQSGSIRMVAQVRDSLGAVSPTQSDTIQINPASFGRRWGLSLGRRLLASPTRKSRGQRELHCVPAVRCRL